jgi:hypothetical protein
MKVQTLALALSLFPALAAAQPRPQVRQDRREIRQDQREVRQDQRQLADDRRDARRYANLLAAFDQAKAGPPGALAAVDQRVIAALNAEIAESNREAGQKQAEAGRSQLEAGRGRRELAGDVARGQPVRAADDRRDLRDDRRDARDDRRDANRELMDNARLRALHQEYSALMARPDPASVERRRNILVDLNRMAAAEIREGQRELREDKRELREDRRELREDRRQLR